MTVAINHQNNEKLYHGACSGIETLASITLESNTRADGNYVVGRTEVSSGGEGEICWETERVFTSPCQRSARTLEVRTVHPKAIMQIVRGATRLVNPRRFSAIRAPEWTKRFWVTALFPAYCTNADWFWRDRSVNPEPKTQIRSGTRMVKRRCGLTVPRPKLGS